MKYIVCYSGGHSSALVAIEAVRKHGKENVILLNHNITTDVEDEDTKRFKNEIARHLGLDVYYANMDGWEIKGPLEVCMKVKTFKVGAGAAVCTNRLKTKPFYKWLSKNFPTEPFKPREDVTILYGFDKDEPKRIQRRIEALLAKGYKSDYPLAFWDRTIFSTEEIGIKKPSQYETYRHANCVGCIKAGKQHWYIVYCTRRDLWEKAKQAELEIGYPIMKGVYLDELEHKFELMKNLGIVPTERISSQRFWADVRKALPDDL